MRNILDFIPLHHSSFAYQKNKSIVQCASQHVGASWAIKLDLRNFFGSVDEKKIYNIFYSLGFTPLLSFELARICTVEGFYNLESDKKYNIFEYNNKMVGYLPQGSPTSGALSNIVFKEIDSEIQEFATKNSLVYTRYSDDIVISGIGEYSKNRCISIIYTIEKILKKYKFTLQNSKTKIISPNRRIDILGLTLKEECVDLRSDWKQRLLMQIRFTKNLGISRAAELFGFKSPISYINHINGKIHFAQSVNMGFAGFCIQRWKNIVGELYE